MAQQAQRVSDGLSLLLVPLQLRDEAAVNGLSLKESGHGVDDRARLRRLSRRRLLVTGAAAAWTFVFDRAAPATTHTIQLICERAWGARRHTGGFVRQKVHRITIHHSGVVLRENRRAPATLRAEQRFHQSQGWPDIAYHLIIDRHGNVYRGRPPWAKGNTFTDYDPRGHLLVMCLGNFEEQKPTKAMLAALVDVCAWGCKRFDVPPSRIHGHRDFASTACPGRHLYALIQDGSIGRRVKLRLAAGIKHERLCGRAGRRRVAAIEQGKDQRPGGKGIEVEPQPAYLA